MNNNDKQSDMAKKKATRAEIAYNLVVDVLKPEFALKIKKTMLEKGNGFDMNLKEPVVKGRFKRKVESEHMSAEQMLLSFYDIYRFVYPNPYEMSEYQSLLWNLADALFKSKDESLYVFIFPLVELLLGDENVDKLYARLRQSRSNLTAFHVPEKDKEAK